MNWKQEGHRQYMGYAINGMHLATVTWTQKGSEIRLYLGRDIKTLFTEYEIAEAKQYAENQLASFVMLMIEPA